MIRMIQTKRLWANADDELCVNSCEGSGSQSNILFLLYSIIFFSPVLLFRFIVINCAQNRRMLWQHRDSKRIEYAYLSRMSVSVHRSATGRAASIKRSTNGNKTIKLKLKCFSCMPQTIHIIVELRSRLTRNNNKRIWKKSI